jgi:hypothetical protein
LPEAVGSGNKVLKAMLPFALFLYFQNGRQKREAMDILITDLSQIHTMCRYVFWMDAGVFRACKQSWMDGTRRWKMHFGWVRFMLCFDYDVGCGAWWIVGLYWMDAWEGESLLELGCYTQSAPWMWW